MTLRRVLPSRPREAFRPRPFGVVGVLLVLSGAAHGEEPLAPAAASSVAGYRTQAVQGWTVHVSDALRADRPEEVDEALALIDGQLAEIARFLPEKPLAAVRQVPIWLSPAYDGFRPTGEYHPNAAWLKQNGRRAELAKSVELTNVPNFKRECERMPMLMMHELAHAYHDRTLGFDDPRVITAYDAAKRSGSYEAVRRHDGRTARSYALTDHKEYFAESTEAYFGRNDFFPFHREELLRHDPRMHELLRLLWQDEPAPDPADLDRRPSDL